MLDIELPIMNAILPSNHLQIEKGLQMIMEKGNKKVGILGLSFKAGTDDLRESPMVEVIERLLGKGYEVAIYDRNVEIASIMGANRDYILNHIPHIFRLMKPTIEEILSRSETIVIGNNDPEFSGILSKISDDQVIVDLVRIADVPEDGDLYDGICW